MFPDARILVFCKAPVPGQVKTRLIEVLGAEGAAGLHRCLASRTLRMATEADVAPVELWCYPDVTAGFFREAKSEHGVSLFEQEGADLGERMANALRNALGRNQHAVLIGTDCPVLEGAHLVQTIQALREGADAVLGPARDGGYVLIGLSRMCETVFGNIPWGTETVLRETQMQLRHAGFRWQELAELWDVDTQKDLEDLRRLEGGLGACMKNEAIS